MSIHESTLHALSGQRCLVIEPYFQTPAVETGLEVAETLAARNTVTYLGPDRLRLTTDESYVFTTRVLHRLSRKRRVSKYLSPSVDVVSGRRLKAWLDALPRQRIETFLDEAGADLDTAHYEHFDLGQSLRSSMISVTRDIAWTADTADPFTRRLARDALWLYELTLALIDRLGLDLVVLFNGRLAPVRAIRRACEAKTTRYWAHERGSALHKFALHDNATPHSPAAYRGWVDDWWRWSEDGTRRAEEFLARRRGGRQTNWFAFTQQQQRGSVPPKGTRRRVAFFTSSEDEMAAIGDELAPDSPLCVQSTAIREVGSACREAGYELAVRFHPNTPAREYERLMPTARDMADIVCEPQSTVDTYALMDSADIVFTHNSTAGLEAAAVGKPAFYTGRNVFEDCLAMRRLTSPEGIHEALQTPDGFHRVDALKYLNYLAGHGIPYRFYQPRGLIAGKYRGKDLSAPLSTLRDLRVRMKRGGR